MIAKSTSVSTRAEEIAAAVGLGCTVGLVVLGFLDIRFSSGCLDVVVSVEPRRKTVSSVVCLSEETGGRDGAIFSLVFRPTDAIR